MLLKPFGEEIGHTLECWRRGCIGCTAGPEQGTLAPSRELVAPSTGVAPGRGLLAPSRGLLTDIKGSAARPPKKCWSFGGVVFQNDKGYPYHFEKRPPKPTLFWGRAAEPFIFPNISKGCPCVFGPEQGTGDPEHRTGDPEQGTGGPEQGPPSAVGRRPWAIGRGPSAVGRRPSAVGRGPSAVGRRPPAVAGGPGG